MIAKLISEAKFPHPLARFVTLEAIAHLLQVPCEHIREIRCWTNVILVVGRGFCQFVSYADLPPVVGVEPPQTRDFLRWRKRWRKNRYKAPEFWKEFYAQKLRQTASAEELSHWGQLLSQMESNFSSATQKFLSEVYRQENKDSPKS